MIFSFDKSLCSARNSWWLHFRRLISLQAINTDLNLMPVDIKLETSSAVCKDAVVSSMLLIVKIAVLRHVNSLGCRSDEAMI